jgi:hypothetical protein
MERLLAIEDAVRMAWIALERSPAGRRALSAMAEEEITAALQEELARLRHGGNCPAFGDGMFGPPERSSKHTSLDGSVNSQPDIAFSLMRQVPLAQIRADALIAECKVIDFKSRRNLSQYVLAGLNRFVDGTYAWAMPQAMMIAYVFSTQEIPEALENYFASPSGVNRGAPSKLLSVPTLCRESAGRKLHRVALTTHSREPLAYEGDLLGDIEIRHLWLNAP